MRAPAAPRRPRSPYRGRMRALRPEPPPDPEPLSWRPAPTVRDRLLRALSLPVALGATAFVAAVVVAIALVAAQPRDPGDAVETEPRLAQASANSPANDGSVADDPSSATPQGPAASEASVWVHVVGEVIAPGVVELPAGARVEAALTAAGGPTERAVLSGVNLARPVVDGEQIVVPDAALLAVSPIPTGPTVPGAPGSPAPGMVNLNTADRATLESLPGVGPALAQRILDWRAANGAFATIEQLLNVSGIGPKILDRMRDRVTV